MRKLITLFCTFLLSACVSNTGIPTSVQNVVSDPAIGMVVTANPHASKAGADILRAGGSAVDAAIAIQAVLSLVEPQSSGLGGGGFMVYFDNQTNSLAVYDGRETAPAAANPTMFLNADGASLGFIKAKNSGLSTGVPGMVALLKLAHDDHGELPWGEHFDRARQLAREGFPISPRLHDIVQRFGKYIPQTAADGPLDAYRYFYDQNGEPLAVGALRTNPAYAKTLELIASDPSEFYRGVIAKQVVEQTSQAPRAGSLTLADMAAYKAQKRIALCAPYRAYRLCGPPPASSWVAVGETLGLLEYAPSFSARGAADANNWALFAEAQRLAYADRDRYIADDRFVEIPLNGMLNRGYLKQRARLISNESANADVAAGDPWAFERKEKVAVGEDATNDIAGTTHFVVVDAQGDVVSMTASVESIFGSTRMAGGMFLNNQLTDFSFQPTDDTGQPIANRVEAGKRPRSSMSPTIVLDQDGEFVMASGSPGGNSIIAYTAKTLIGVLDWGLSPQAAVELPNMVARGNKVRIEKERASDALIAGLNNFGFQVTESAGENSGLSVVLRRPDGTLEGGVDPRREGVIETVEFAVER